MNGFKAIKNLNGEPSFCCGIQHGEEEDDLFKCQKQKQTREEEEEKKQIDEFQEKKPHRKEESLTCGLTIEKRESTSQEEAAIMDASDKKILKQQGHADLFPEATAAVLEGSEEDEIHPHMTPRGSNIFSELEPGFCSLLPLTFCSNATPAPNLSFNTDCSCFATSIDQNFRIYSCEPFCEIFCHDFDHGGIGAAKMNKIRRATTEKKKKKKNSTNSDLIHLGGVDAAVIEVVAEDLAEGLAAVDPEFVVSAGGKAAAVFVERKIWSGGSVGIKVAAARAALNEALEFAAGKRDSQMKLIIPLIHVAGRELMLTSMTQMESPLESQEMMGFVDGEYSINPAPIISAPEKSMYGKEEIMPNPDFVSRKRSDANGQDHKTSYSFREETSLLWGPFVDEHDLGVGDMIRFYKADQISLLSRHFLIGFLKERGDPTESVTAAVSDWVMVEEGVVRGGNRLGDSGGGSHSGGHKGWKFGGLWQ
ncbi:hypothetical protein RHMOL_Rhmol13G0061700 [Rhododendron molle]|uniref:Uncharacterized protein n=1 Tax=Rhododendron molle TaxID=49168 RepID=A0ACC0L451_RHOML|nr:hypothetical protein RHMOL_Rhmol13G0061700 [Rhododendron molle]